MRTSRTADAGTRTDRPSPPPSGVRLPPPPPRDDPKRRRRKGRGDAFVIAGAVLLSSTAGGMLLWLGEGDLTVRAALFSLVWVVPGIALLVAGLVLRRHNRPRPMSTEGIHVGLIGVRCRKCSHEGAATGEEPDWRCPVCGARERVAGFAQ
jgi:hypothetical protein